MNTNELLTEEAFSFQSFYKIRDRALGRILSKVKRYVGRYIEQRLPELGFPDFKASYLAFLANLEEGGITNNELARRAGVTKQAMSKVVKLLEDDGYIYTVKNEQDSRSSRIFLNERGKQLLVALLVCMQEVREKFDAIAGHERVEAMIDTMTLLVQELDKETDYLPFPGSTCV
ncbi:hypothetical protein GCM10027347_37050 [Larkinella harenae]